MTRRTELRKRPPSSVAPLPGQARAQKITEADKIGSEVRGIMLHTNQEREREREERMD